MDQRKTVLVLASLLAVAAVTGVETDARACGGCFVRPETTTVVTDHRMIFSISRKQSTLYDQIKYTGEPSSFGWVLPFSGEIVVGLSSDTLFSTLDGRTQTRILAPPLNCPTRPSSCKTSQSAKRAATDPEDGASGGVEVLKHEVVGPYETVQLKATDPMALADWLAQNGYVIPADVQPVVAAYQKQNFNFLALKLVPGKGVQDMRPVRVTTKGANVALPLRMVAAGTGAKVGITLWVIGEGRYEPQNFGSFTILADELTWDWSQRKSDYTDLRAAKTAAGAGRVWEVETSLGLLRGEVESAMRNYNNDIAISAYPNDKNDERAAEKARDDDIATLYDGITFGTERTTRLRADLDHASLNEDLVLRAAADQSVLEQSRQVTKEKNEPSCPVYDGCEVSGTAPRSQAIAQTTDNGDGSCAAPRRLRVRTPSTWLAIALAFVGALAGRTWKRRRS